MGGIELSNIGRNQCVVTRFTWTWQKEENFRESGFGVMTGPPRHEVIDAGQKISLGEVKIPKDVALPYVLVGSIKYETWIGECSVWVAQKVFGPSEQAIAIDIRKIGGWPNTG